jgi:hypothetical protein
VGSLVLELPVEETSFDGLQQILEALQANRDDPVVVMSSYHLYCDAGGGEDHGFIVVAGYLSTFEKWNAFTAQWNCDLLGAFDVPYFHMKEFSQSEKIFKSWKGNEPRRARFMATAAGIIGNHVEEGFSCIVSYHAFDKVNKTYALSEAVGVPYSLAARTCVARASLTIGRDKDVTYVFEDGDKGKGELVRVMGRDGYPSPIFRPSRDTVSKSGQKIRGVVPLQSADFAAYEIRKVYKDDPDESWPLNKYRKSLQAIAQIRSSEPDWGKYTEQDLIRLCREAGIPSRTTKGEG